MRTPRNTDATRTWKKGFGFHPLLSFVDHGGPSGGEPVAELLRPGKAGSNTAADHVVVLDAALAQLPAHLRARDDAGRVAVLVRTDAAGATKEFAAHLQQQGVEFSVGASFAHLDVAGCGSSGSSPTDRGGPGHQLADLELRHRRHARVEDRIAPPRTPGCGTCPSMTPTRTASGRHRRARPGPAGLVRPARPAPDRRRLRTETDAATHPRHRRPAHPHRPPPRPAHRPDLALGCRDHHRARPTVRAPVP